MRRSIYLKILVPIDGSEFSFKALLHACELAKLLNSKILIVYVVEKLFPLNLDRNEYSKLLRKFGKESLEKARKAALSKGVEPKMIQLEGNITNEIVKCAKKERCNLIVVGQKGFGKALRFFLGSISNKLANESPCSVLIVK